MATTSSLPSKGLRLVLVEYEYKYQDRDGVLVSIKPNERYILLTKTNDHWWQVCSDQNSKPFYIPAKYVKELPPDFPSPLDFVQPSSLESVLLPTATPVVVPVPVPKTLDEPTVTKTKVGDAVAIRLRPDGNTGYRKTENRMSTFGVPLDFHELSPLELTSRHSSNPSAGVAEIRTTNSSRTTTMADDTKKYLLGVPEDHRDSGIPADPLCTPRTQPIPVDMPVVPCLRRASSPSSDFHDNQESLIEQEEEKEEEEEQKGEEDESLKDEDSNHIYESIQDLNLDVEALAGGRVSPEAQATSPTQNCSSDDPKLPIYANIMSVKKSSLSQISGSSSPPPDHAPSTSVSSTNLSPPSPLTPQDGCQVFSDLDNTTSLHFQDGTQQATRTEPPGPTITMPPQRDMDQSRGSDVGQLTNSCSPLSPISSQGFTDRELLTDEVSGRLYYYNPTTRATPCVAPEQLSPSSPDSPTASGRHNNSPPPLPEEDYPVDEWNNGDTTMNPQKYLVPRAQCDLKDGNSSKLSLQELPSVPQRLMGNGVCEEGSTVHVKNWRHSMAEDTSTRIHRRNVSEVTDVLKTRHSTDGLQPFDRLRPKRNLSNRSTDSHQRHYHLLEKAGIINKTKVAESGKKIRKNWTQSWTVLHGGVLTFHKDPKSAQAGNTSKSSQIVPEFTVDLRGALVGWAPKDKSSKKNVLELKTRQGCEYLMQYDTESIICDWLKVIQDAIRQLEQDHLSEDEDEAEEDKDGKKTANRSSSGASDSEQRRVRTKLRRFLQRRPTLQSVKEKGYIRDNVFGCHLDTLCHRENTTIPHFVEKCVKTVERRGLDVDGIYRVSGNLAVIQKLRHKADHEEHLDLEDGQWEEIHVITGALKLFLRELPEPLFPFSCFDKFIAAIQVPDYELRVSYMKDLVRLLPLPNHDTMELLFKHLRRVIEHKDSNRMSVQSIAIVFGPTLLRPQTESANMTIHMVFQSQIVELMLNEFQTIFSQS